MSRTRKTPDIGLLLHSLTATGEGAPSEAEKLRLVRSLRGQNQETDALIDEFLVRDTYRLRIGLAEAQSAQAQLRKRLERLAAPPYHPAILLGRMETARGPSAMVCHGNSRRVVAIAEDADLDGIDIGDEVLLGSELNVVIQKSPYPPQRGGETAVFDRYTEDGRILIKWRDDEVVVDAAATLGKAPLRNGDLLRWDRTLWLALEGMERSRGDHLFLEETPAETFDDIGGLDEAIEQLQGLIQIHMEHPQIASKYWLQRKGAVLLTGPPGTGKTLLARALANWLSRIYPSGRSRFINLKPGSLHSVWYSETERNYREVFKIAREAAREHPDIPVVIFIDEIDSIGRSRSDSLTRIDDRVLPAFMAELSGLEERGNVLVIAATNRPDALDPALLRGKGRLGDLRIEVPRPRRDAARAIFEKHLREDIPFAVDGHDGDGPAARRVIVDAALSRIFAPNGDGDLATITFRDGKRRVLRPNDLVSGAGIAKICQDAIERACRREIETGESGIRTEDLFRAIDEEFEHAAGVLTPINCHKHVSGIPQDVDVASIEPVRRKTSRTHRYLRIA